MLCIYYFVNVTGCTATPVAKVARVYAKGQGFNTQRYLLGTFLTFSLFFAPYSQRLGPYLWAFPFCWSLTLCLLSHTWPNFYYFIFLFSYFLILFYLSILLLFFITIIIIFINKKSKNILFIIFTFLYFIFL